jgi:predicted nucleotidyltransferase component of viral defense system
VREYIQHLFLAELYKIREADKLLFKGGTALRVAFLSPRFSEDLDFTGVNIFRHKEIDDWFLAVLAELEKMGIDIYFKEAKPTSGGYLGLIQVLRREIGKYF